MGYRILAVDDEEAIRVMLQQFLNSLGHQVDTACDGMDALEALEKQRYDLVLSDINMPRMKGFELLKKVRERYPKTKRALITAYDVNDYLRLALEHGVGNIIPKTTPFSFDEIRVVVTNLLSESFFGLQRYLREGTTLAEARLTCHAQIMKIAEQVSSNVPDSAKASRLALVMNELLTNAVYYGGRCESSGDKATWKTDFELPPEKAVEVRWATDNEKLGFSVADTGGKLKKEDVLYWLCRQVERDEKGVPKGVFDSHGRGFFIARTYVDSLVVNIKAGYRTEVIGLAYNNQSAVRHKPLYINEV